MQVSGVQLAGRLLPSFRRTSQGTNATLGPTRQQSLAPKAAAKQLPQPHLLSKRPLPPSISLHIDASDHTAKLGSHDRPMSCASAGPIPSRGNLMGVPTDGMQAVDEVKTGPTASASQAVSQDQQVLFSSHAVIPHTNNGAAITSTDIFCGSASLPLTVHHLHWFVLIRCIACST